MNSWLRFAKKLSASSAATKRDKHVFSQGEHWADDVFANLQTKAAQYRLAAGCLLLLSLVLGIAISVMMPLHQTDLVVVHQSNDGVAWVSVPTSAQVMPTQTQTESELVNYVTNRESYSAFSYDYQYKLINLMSSDEMAKTYRDEQDANNPHSTIALLGDEGIRKVHVESVIFLDNENQNNAGKGITGHKNLAQVNYLVITKQDNQNKTIPYTAMIAWDYRGTPDSPEAKWLNWDGFTVTAYNITQRNI